jgi:hypothetical protein
MVIALKRPLMPRSDQRFRPDLAMKLLWITLRNKRWPTTFHTIVAGDAYGRMVPGSGRCDQLLNVRGDV